MKRVITYGTFDLFHEGHYRLLKRAKELGDYLIVGVTTESYDEIRGKLNVQEGLMKRIENVKNSGLADEILIEEYEGQKVNDILKYRADIFAIGSDWVGKFDYLKEYCDVIYLERTKGISSTQLRAQHNGILSLGVIGCRENAKRFVQEAKYVSGVHIEGVYGPNSEALEGFAEKYELDFVETDFNAFLERVEAVYIASPHRTHYQHVKHALERGKHVLCEKPLVLSAKHAEEVYALAAQKGCVLLEAIETAYAPSFIRLISVAKSGLIGSIKNVDVTFTKLSENAMDEHNTTMEVGSITGLASNPLLAVVKLLGVKIRKLNFYSYFNDSKQIDLFTKVNLTYKNAIATVKVGYGIFSEGDLVISGTKGFIYVPSPWWKTESFEVRYGDSNKNKKHFYKFEGDGLRYELAEFVSMIKDKRLEIYKLTPLESMTVNGIIESFLVGENIEQI